jgi:hypothetical protein
MREPGFYWVKGRDLSDRALYGGWTICEYSQCNDPEKKERWYIDMRMEDDSFWAEIDERRIIQKPQCKDNPLKGAKIVGFIQENDL